MRILICGDRHWVDTQSVINRLTKTASITGRITVIEGEADGADWCARDAAQTLGFHVDRYPAPWGKYGKAAGPIRNAQMLKEGRPDVVWAFHDDLAHSKGTYDMIRQATQAKVPIYHFSHEHPEGRLVAISQRGLVNYLKSENEYNMWGISG